MADVKFCVVCGEGSNREDWKNKSESFVACDRHSTGEISEAIKKVKSSAPVATA